MGVSLYIAHSIHLDLLVMLTEPFGLKDETIVYSSRRETLNSKTGVTPWEAMAVRTVYASPPG